MATNGSVRIASTTNHGNLRFSPRVVKRARSSGPAFSCFRTQSIYSTCHFRARVKSWYEIFRLPLNL